jgi:lipid-A-disaccharide synthase
MAVILPFEADFYRQHKIPATFVGHPLLDNVTVAMNEKPANQVGDTSVIGLFPGSREKEVARHLPIMLDAANVLNRKMKNLRFLISLAPTVKRSYIEELISKHKGDIRCELLSDDVDQIFKRCQFAIVVSGTVSLEAAIAGTPMVIIYRISPLSYLLGRAMIKVEYAGLINLIEGREVVPELLQNDAAPENIAQTVFEMMKDPIGLEKLRDDLLEAVKKLGGAGASERTADIAMGLL